MLPAIAIPPTPPPPPAVALLSVIVEFSAVTWLDAKMPPPTAEIHAGNAVASNRRSDRADRIADGYTATGDGILRGHNVVGDR